MKVGLAAIAARAGVSVATVSRVLNEKPGVHPATRRAVLTAVDILGYDGPTTQRSQSTGLVGVIVPDLENPVFPRFAQAIEAHLANSGYTPVLCSRSLGGINEDSYVETLLTRGVSGIFFVSGNHANVESDPAPYRRLADLGIPMVLVNGYVPDIAGAFLSNDDYKAVDLAVAHLVSLGHHRIGLAVGQRRYSVVQRRIAGFAASMRQHLDPTLTDTDLDELVAATFFAVEGGTSAALSLLARGVTAIVCASDLMALGAMQAAQQQGLRVPGDLSIIGSDDSRLVNFTNPPLTTVRMPVEMIATEGCRVMLDMIDGGAAPAAEILYAPELVLRDSTARARHGWDIRSAPAQAESAHEDLETPRLQRES